MGSWSGTLPSKQAERPHFRTTVDIALPIMQAGQRGWSGDRESWSGSPHSGQAAPPTFRTTVGIAPHRHPEWAERMAWDVDGHDRAHPPSKPAEPHLTRNRRHGPSPPPGMGRGVRPTGPAEWYKIRLLPIHAVQPTGPVRRVRAAASAEAV